MEGSAGQVGEVPVFLHQRLSRLLSGQMGQELGVAGVFEGFDPSLSTAEAWASMSDPTMSVVAASEEQMIGQNQATVTQMRNVNNNNDQLFTMYLFRLAPDKILFVSPLFQDRLGADDIQGILTSLSLSPDVPIQVPTVAPHEPLIAATCTEN